MRCVFVSAAAALLVPRPGGISAPSLGWSLSPVAMRCASSRARLRPCGASRVVDVPERARTEHHRHQLHERGALDLQRLHVGHHRDGEHPGRPGDEPVGAARDQRHGPLAPRHVAPASPCEGEHRVEHQRDPEAPFGLARSECPDEVAPRPHPGDDGGERWPEPHDQRARVLTSRALPHVRRHRRGHQQAQRAFEAVEEREHGDRPGRETEPHDPLHRSGDEHRLSHRGDHRESDVRADARQQLSVHGAVSATACAVPGGWDAPALAPRPDARRAGSGRPGPLPARVRARSVR